MTNIASKKSSLPAFVGIYSPDSARSKSFSGGSLSALEQLRSVPGGGNGAGVGGPPARSKDESPFSKSSVGRTLNAYTTSGAGAGGAHVGTSPSAAAHRGAAPVRVMKQRASTSEVSVSSEASSIPPALASLSTNSPLRSRISAPNMPSAGTSPGAGGGGSAASFAAISDPPVASGRKSLGIVPAARGAAPLVRAAAAAVRGGGSGGLEAGASDRAEADGEGERGDETDAAGEGEGGTEAWGRSLAGALADALSPGGRSRSGSGELDLPRLGVRFPGNAQAAGGSPLKQKAPEAVSRGTSFTAGSSGLRGTSFTAGKAPGTSNLYRVKWLDFGLSPEQQVAKATAERVARSALAKHAAKADESRSFPREAVAAAGKEGFGGVAVPASVGGMGLNANDGALVFEALGMGDTSVAGYLTLHNMVAWLVAHHATPSLQQQVLRNLASTALLAAYAMTEPASGSDPAAITTAAVAGVGGYTLTGTKSLVAGAAVADVFLVLARTSEQPTKGLSLFLVNKTSQGLSIGRPEKSLGWRSVSLASLNLQGCVVRADALVGKEGQGLELLNSALDQQRVWLSAVSVGGAQFALDYAISHGKTRKHGTKAVTDLQAVQFRFVDLHAELQAARLMVRSAAQQLDAKAPSRSVSAALAKQFATDTAATVAAEVCSLMGGAGMVGEHPVERIARDLRTHTVVGGSNEQLLSRSFSEMQRTGSVPGASA